MQKHIELLRTIPWFARLSESELAVLANNVAMCEFGRGELIFSQESDGSILYIIVSGQVQIFRNGSNGQEFALAVFYDGEFFGELALIDGLPRAASAKAMCETKTLTLHRNNFLRTISTHPSVAASILEVMATRLRQSNTYAELRVSASATKRVSYHLVDLATRKLAHRTAPSDDPIDLLLTQDDLASLSSTTRETVNRVLSSLRAQKLIQIERGHILITNIAMLRSVSDI